MKLLEESTRGNTTLAARSCGFFLGDENLRERVTVTLKSLMEGMKQEILVSASSLKHHLN